MEERNLESIGENFLHTIIRSIRKFWILIVVIVMAATAVGAVYALTRTPNYTAPETVVYKAQNSYSDSTVNNINAMSAFIGTIIDFCDEEVVIDRANYYYSMYLNAKAREGEDYTVEQYIGEVRVNDNYNYEQVDKQRIFAQNVAVSEISEDEESKFSFTISYTDVDKVAARDKAKILVLAVDMESKETVVIDNVSQNKYFAGINNQLLDYGTGRITSDVSIVKIVAVAFVLGIIIAFASIYLIYILDNTIKTKEELKDASGADVLAFISQHGGR